MGAELGATAISHLEHASAEGIAAMSAAGTVAVLLPTTAYILRLQPPPARDMIDQGVPVALGTDFNPNAYCLSMVGYDAEIRISSNVSVNGWEDALLNGLFMIIRVEPSLRVVHPVKGGHFTADNLRHPPQYHAQCRVRDHAQGCPETVNRRTVI